MSTPNLLLLTGGTGFIGFHVLLKALAAGWTVRAAIRSLSKADSLAKHPKIVALGVPDKLSFVEVPDICAANAYDEAIKGATHVIHLASPLPSPFLDPLTGIYQPNINSVTALLNATLKAPTLKKLVITSSVFGNSPFPPDLSQRITADFRVPNLPGPFDSMMPAYWGGKIAATNAIDAFYKEKSPPYGLSVIYPGFVFGADKRALKAEDFMASTNRILLGVVTGHAADSPMPAGAVHVEDAATLHILALQDDAPRNIGSTIPHVFDEAWDAVAKHYPEAVKAGVLSKGSQPTIPVIWDASKTETDLGVKFQSWEDMVVDSVGQYLELSGKAKA
ncbi:putative cinnamoyl-CoA reductase [Hypoxylon argillaceum]|nr:putative cinnamoyl-CoA reductase [Hypoxylon argillaceum]KAI1148868.1 putative cinnamoyl-CoA reductase [Nemania diffusa]